jgi:hypothetical protein
MKLPRSLRGAAKFRPDRTSDNLQPIPHARKQSIEHVVAEVPPPGEVLADAGLTHATDPGQLGLGDAGFQHYLTQDLTTGGHDRTIARTTIVMLPTTALDRAICD